MEKVTTASGIQTILDDVRITCEEVIEVIWGRSFKNGARPSFVAREYDNKRGALEAHVTGYDGFGQIVYLRMSGENIGIVRKAIKNIHSKISEYFPKR